MKGIAWIVQVIKKRCIAMSYTTILRREYMHQNTKTRRNKEMFEQ